MKVSLLEYVRTIRCFCNLQSAICIMTASYLIGNRKQERKKEMKKMKKKNRSGNKELNIRFISSTIETRKTAPVAPPSWHPDPIPPPSACDRCL